MLDKTIIVNQQSYKNYTYIMKLKLLHVSLFITLQTCQWRGLARMAHLLFGMDGPTYHVIQLNIILDLLISASYFPIFTL